MAETYYVNRLVGPAGTPSVSVKQSSLHGIDINFEGPDGDGRALSVEWNGQTGWTIITHNNLPDGTGLVLKDNGYPVVTES